MQGWSAPGYTEVRALGSGGFGDVVLARHDASGNLVAIKYLRRTLLDDPEFAAMFRAEASVLASLDDPNVVRLYEYLESPSGAAIVMEFVYGASLREILSRQGQTSAESALVVLQGSLLGLGAAHARGVVHRDYKPENVLVDGAGASKLTDFGIAARTGDRQIPAGTLAYAPPEQFGDGPARPASDVYAATATFYECLTGHPPFTGNTTELLRRQHESEPVPLEPVPDPLRALVAAGLAKDPARRPTDAGAFVAELRTAAGPAYGQDWEQRGRSHLGEAAALLLAALWPSGAAPATQGQSVQQVHLHQGAQGTPHAQHLGHAEHLRHLEHQHAEHVEHIEHVQHVQHVQHLEHAGTRSQRFIRHASQSKRAPRWVRRALPHNPGPAAATGIVAGVAAVVAAVVAAIAAAVIPSGTSPLSVAGAWSDGKATFTFTSSGPDSYNVSLVSKNAPQCVKTDDGTVTGSNGHYKGEIDLWQQGQTTTSGSCEPNVGVGQLSIAIAASGTWANVDVVGGGGDCTDCTAQIWNRQS